MRRLTPLPEDPRTVTGSPLASRPSRHGPLLRRQSVISRHAKPARSPAPSPSRARSQGSIRATLTKPHSWPHTGIEPRGPQRPGSAPRPVSAPKPARPGCQPPTPLFRVLPEAPLKPRGATCDLSLVEDLLRSLESGLETAAPKRPEYLRVQRIWHCKAIVRALQRCCGRSSCRC
jgi:hypothetical protein